MPCAPRLPNRALGGRGSSNNRCVYTAQNNTAGNATIDGRSRARYLLYLFMRLVFLSALCLGHWSQQAGPETRQRTPGCPGGTGLGPARNAATGGSPRNIPAQAGTGCQHEPSYCGSTCSRKPHSVPRPPPSIPSPRASPDGSGHHLSPPPLQSRRSNRKIPHRAPFAMRKASTSVPSRRGYPGGRAPTPTRRDGRQHGLPLPNATCRAA